MIGIRHRLSRSIVGRHVGDTAETGFTLLLTFWAAAVQLNRRGFGRGFFTEELIGQCLQASKINGPIVGAYRWRRGDCAAEAQCTRTIIRRMQPGNRSRRAG